jgi:Tfp pilus assembly PilM family ATPase
MRHLSLFTRVFPPPDFLTMPHTGLEISDDAFRAIEYKLTARGFSISKFATMELPAGVLEGGDIRDEKQFFELLSKFTKEHRMSYVKVSLPEEKVYLFQTDIPSTEVKAITQNVEFKLEENVPLSSADAVFYFDILPSSVTAGVLRASVSVAPRTYVEKYISLLRSLNLSPIAFEVAPKSIAKAILPQDSDDAELIVHSMNKKTGIYIVAGGVVCFSSTIPWGTRLESTTESKINAETLIKEVDRVLSYWSTRPDTHSTISKIVVVGKDAPIIMETLRSAGLESLPPVVVADVWHNSFDVNTYLPPISKDQSLEYAVAAGLALL